MLRPTPVNPNPNPLLTNAFATKANPMLEVALVSSPCCQSGYIVIEVVVLWYE